MGAVEELWTMQACMWFPNNTCCGGLGVVTVIGLSWMFSDGNGFLYGRWIKQ